MRKTGAIGSGIGAPFDSALGTAGARRALVSESPLAKSVTSCPRDTSASQRLWMTRSVPPYCPGGTGRDERRDLRDPDLADPFKNSSRVQAPYPLFRSSGQR